MSNYCNLEMKLKFFGGESGYTFVFKQYLEISKQYLQGWSLKDLFKMKFTSRITHENFQWLQSNVEDYYHMNVEHWAMSCERKFVSNEGKKIIGHTCIFLHTHGYLQKTRRGHVTKY